MKRIVLSLFALSAAATLIAGCASLKPLTQDDLAAISGQPASTSQAK